MQGIKARRRFNHLSLQDWYTLKESPSIRIYSDKKRPFDFL